MPGTEPRPQRWEARVLPLCHRGPTYRNRSGFQGDSFKEQDADEPVFTSEDLSRTG